MVEIKCSLDVCLHVCVCAHHSDSLGMTS